MEGKKFQMLKLLSLALLLVLNGAALAADVPPHPATNAEMRVPDAWFQCGNLGPADTTPLCSQGTSRCVVTAATISPPRGFNPQTMFLPKLWSWECSSSAFPGALHPAQKVTIYWQDVTAVCPLMGKPNVLACGGWGAGQMPCSMCYQGNLGNSNAVTLDGKPVTGTEASPNKWGGGPPNVLKIGHRCIITSEMQGGANGSYGQHAQCSSTWAPWPVKS